MFYDKFMGQRQKHYNPIFLKFDVLVKYDIRIKNVIFTVKKWIGKRETRGSFRDMLLLYNDVTSGFYYHIRYIKL